MQLSPTMLAAVEAELQDAARGWRLTTVQQDSHERLTLSGQDLVEVTERTATMTFVSDVKGMVMIFMIEGPAAGEYTKGKLIINGNAFTFTDADLLHWLLNGITAYEAIAEAEATEGFGPVEAA